MLRRPSPKFAFLEREVRKLRCEGCTISAIGAVVDLPPVAIERILAARGMLAPWSLGWRARVGEREA